MRKHWMLGMLLGVALVGGACGRADTASEPIEQEEEALDSKVDDTESDVASKDNDEAKADNPGGMDAEAEMDETHYEGLYAPVVTEIAEVMQNGYDENRDYNYLGMGLMEKLMYEGKEALQMTIGYAIMDINGDEIPELLIGETVYNGFDGSESSTIYMGYSIVDGELVNFLDGYARSSYQWLGDDSFYYFGSNGAMSSMFGSCHLSADGKELEWDDFYFSDEANGEIFFYHNTTGEFDKEKSDWLNLSEEEFWKIMDTYTLQPLSFNKIADNVSIEDKLNDPLENYYGTWLYPSGAAIVINDDFSWQLYDDSENWLCDGQWVLYEDADPVHIKLYSQIGDAGNEEVAEAEPAVDTAGDLIICVDFMSELFDCIGSGDSVLYKKP